MDPLSFSEGIREESLEVPTKAPGARRKQVAFHWDLLLAVLCFFVVAMVLFFWLRNQMEKKWTEVFKSISFDLLNNNQQVWANQTKSIVDSFASPLKEALERYQQLVAGLENKRVADFADLKSEIGQLMSAKRDLQKETSALTGALRNPKVGGRWGELTLMRVVELAGMVQYCDFELQATRNTEDGQVRPDLVIHLPSRRDIVVDSKISFEAYLEAASTVDEEQRTLFFKKHAALMKDHLRKLCAKNYWNQFENSPEFVVMFVPGEAFLSAALEHDQGLLEEGMQKGVILATPSTLMALLRAVAFGWRQEEMAKNAVKIGQLGREIIERMMRWSEHLGNIGESLEKTVKAYNAAVNSLESRVLVTARKLNELGGGSDDEFKAPELVQQSVNKNFFLDS